MGHQITSKGSAPSAGRENAANGTTTDVTAGQADAKITAPPGIDLARLAHELRTPLSAIAVLSEIMRDERLGALGNDRYRAYAADIHESAAHANTVLAAFLDTGAADRNTGGPMEFVELDLAQVAVGTVSALTPVAGRAGVGLTMRNQVGLPRVIADRRSVRQMLDNLIANALKYTPPGGEVIVGLAYATGGPVLIEIADTGDGMTPTELERVRAGASGAEALRRRSGGTGIGLPLVRALAAACGATIAFDSTLGKGTSVTITFAHNRVVPI